MTIGRRRPPAPSAARVDAVALAGSERPANAAPEPTSMDLRDIWCMALPFRGPADGGRLANPAAIREISSESVDEPLALERGVPVGAENLVRGVDLQLRAGLGYPRRSPAMEALRLLYLIFCQLIDWLALLTAARRPRTPNSSDSGTRSRSSAVRSPGHASAGQTAPSCRCRPGRSPPSADTI